MAELRSKVLSCYRTLQRTRRLVFRGDVTALESTRQKLNEEFRKNQHVTDATAIEELIKAGYEVSDYLKSNVLQAELNTQKGLYELHIHKDTALLDNMPYLGGENAPKRSRRRSKTDTPAQCGCGNSGDTVTGGCGTGRT